VSQHDYVLENDSGAGFRADANNALLAIVSHNRGSSAPSTTFAGMEYDDTTLGVRRKRDAANAAWRLLRTLDEAIVVARSSNTVLDVSDVGKMFVFTGTFTQTYDAVANLVDGWWHDFKNEGTGVITLDPSGSETIDGVTTIRIYPGESGRVYSDGSVLRTGGRGFSRAEFSAHSTAGTSMVAATPTKAAFNVEDYDYGGAFENSTLFRWVAPRTGIVTASAMLTLGTISDTKNFVVAIYKNGSLVKQSPPSINGSGGVSELGAQIVLHALQVTANDYLEVFGINGDSAPQTLSTTPAKNHFAVSYV
jgi:hypothetical protein